MFIPGSTGPRKPPGDPPTRRAWCRCGTPAVWVPLYRSADVDALPAPTQKSAGGGSFKQLPLAGNWLTGERATADVPFTEQADYTSKQA
ncbi:hypothetical protein YW3DRAFT_04180 [Streptomyces sp. MnatMP-M77]|nr:hypothetical protein YW3DRAFT_04180 [Streptomyces sp. MnatMP-M77]